MSRSNLSLDTSILEVSQDSLLLQTLPWQRVPIQKTWVEIY